MSASPTAWFSLIALLISLGSASCSSSGTGGGAGEGGTSSGGVGGTNTRSACTQSCDDGHACTVDTCVNGKCQSTIGPRTGATACSAGQYCTLESGCVAAPACSTADQCATAWKDDACKTNIKCEAASSVCTFELLDKDVDGHSPQVCGGGDCNDSNGAIHPSVAEKCNGVDDDCDGVVDEDDASTPLCGKLSVCKNGGCTCKPENLCETTCSDVSTDPGNCGSCGHSCGTNAGPSAGWGSWSCVDGVCECPGDICGTVCTSLQEDSENCGTCGTICAAIDAKSTCRNGTCGRHCIWDASMTCSSSQVCKYTTDNGTQCVPDPCPGQTLSCDAPCSASNNCASCSAYNGGNLRCQ